MTGSDDEATPAGWYRQSEDPANLRWWDGDDWTDDWMPTPPGFGRPTTTAERQRSAPEPTPVAAKRSAPKPAAAKPAQAKPGPRRAASATAKADLPAIRIEDPAIAARPRRQLTTDAGPAPRSRSGSDSGERRSRPAGTRSQGSHTAGSRPREDGNQVVQRGPRTVPPVGKVAARALLIAAVVGLGYVGYTKVRDAEPENAKTLSTVASAIPQEPEGAVPVAEAVLTVDDLPAGWLVHPHDPANDAICAGRIPATVIPPIEVANSGFSQGAAGPFIEDSVARFADDATAQRYLELVSGVLADCREYVTDTGTTFLGPLSFPKFGDETFAAALSADSESGPISGHTIHIRVGNRVASIETVTFGSSPIDKELVELLARIVSRRM